jgi:threonine dehydrogenase-like Zn-dependent dehydrogenase
MPTFLSEARLPCLPKDRWAHGDRGSQITRGQAGDCCRERMKRLMRLIETRRVDPTPLTTHRFKFAEVEKAIPHDANQRGRHAQALNFL